METDDPADVSRAVGLQLVNGDTGLKGSDGIHQTETAHHATQ